MEAVVDQVIAELAALNKKADVIIGIMQKPENKVLSILGIIDVLRNWLRF